MSRRRAGNTNPETTLEELTRVREELQGMRVALIALAKADDAFQVVRKQMMRSPLHEAIEVSSNITRLEHQREEAITLCVELGASLH